MSIRNLFTEDVKKILTEDSLNAIEEAFDGRVTLQVETALQEQDDLYAGKLKTLITSIDKDHTKKMRKIMEAVDKKDTSKLAKVIKLYDREFSKDGKNFKKQLVESVSAYLDEYLKESVSKDDIAQAVKNKTAYSVLENLRSVLAVDSVMMKESVKEAVLDGKSKLDKLVLENKELKQQFKSLYEENQKTEVAMFLENKTAKLPESKKNFIRKTLADKSLKFIQENYDYTIRLYDRQEKNKLSSLKEEAINNRTVRPDVVPPQKVVTEQVNNNGPTDMYVQELSRSWSAKK